MELMGEHVALCVLEVRDAMSSITCYPGHRLYHISNTMASPNDGHRTVVIFKLLEHIRNNIIHINGIRNYPTFNNRALKM